jgi:hypothetical protein
MAAPFNLSFGMNGLTEEEKTVVNMEKEALNHARQAHNQYRQARQRETLEAMRLEGEGAIIGREEQAMRRERAGRSLTSEEAAEEDLRERQGGRSRRRRSTRRTRNRPYRLSKKKMVRTRRSFV